MILIEISDFLYKCSIISLKYFSFYFMTLIEALILKIIRFFVSSSSLLSSSFRFKRTTEKIYGDSF